MAEHPDLDPMQVERTGLALVHEGELILPAEGSDALVSVLSGDGALVLEFPVEVEVRLVDPYDPERQADHTLARLLEALEGVT